MIISHKIRLDPNNKQATHLAKAAGTARFAYNWALAEWFASITVDTDQNHLPPAENQGSVGVDLGVSALATLSTGEK